MVAWCCLLSSLSISRRWVCEWRTKERLIYRLRVVLVVKNPPAHSGDIRDSDSIPRSGRSPGGTHDNPLQQLSHGHRSLMGYSPWGCEAGHNWSGLECSTCICHGPAAIILQLLQRPACTSRSSFAPDRWPFLDMWRAALCLSLLLSKTHFTGHKFSIKC